MERAKSSSTKGESSNKGNGKGKEQLESSTKGNGKGKEQLESSTKGNGLSQVEVQSPNGVSTYLGSRASCAPCQTPTIQITSSVTR